jgi:hypothetical protein
LPNPVGSRVKKWVKEIFASNPCYKLIDYKASDYKISVSAETGVVNVNLKELSRQVKEVTQATAHAKMLDDFQYLLCREVNNSADDPDFVKVLKRFRIVAVTYILRLGELLEQIKTDTKNKKLKQELVRVSSRMSRLIYKLEAALEI